MNAQSDPQDVETYAKPQQQIRFIAAMQKIADGRTPGAPVRVYLSAPPQARLHPNWNRWTAAIQEQLPEGAQLLSWETEFGDDRPYDWDSVAGTLDGLVVIGKQRKKGSRVYLLGPAARMELRSLIASRPVLLHAHGLGLVPVIDCKSQVMPAANEHKGSRLKLTAPKRWMKGRRETLQAAFGALGQADSGVGTSVSPARSHLAHPFTPPS